MTISEFKKAISLDGNLKWIVGSGEVLAYLIRAIDKERIDGKLTEKQADKLYDWGHDNCEKIAKKNFLR